VLPVTTAAAHALVRQFKKEKGFVLSCARLNIEHQAENTEHQETTTQLISSHPTGSMANVLHM
jgi:hypothetical protein